MKSSSRNDEQRTTRRSSGNGGKPSERRLPNIPLDDGPAFVRTKVELDRFAKTHPRLDEVADVIEVLIRAGLTLELAYDVAVVLNPPRRHHQKVRSA